MLLLYVTLVNFNCSSICISHLLCSGTVEGGSPIAEPFHMKFIKGEYTVHCFSKILSISHFEDMKAFKVSLNLSANYPLNCKQLIKTKSYH